MTGEEKGGEKKHISIQTNRNRLVNAHRELCSQFTGYVYFISEYQAYGREDYRHGGWGRGWVGVPVQDSLRPGSDL